MFKTIIWYSIILIAVAGFIILPLGFFKAVRTTIGETSTAKGKGTLPDITSTSKDSVATTTKQANLIKIVILGDSIAHGTGDEKGAGFASYLPDYLKNQTSKELSVENIGVDGQESSGLLEQLQNKKLDSLVAVSDIVLISIGGNDLRNLRRLSDTSKQSEFRSLEDKYLENMNKIFKLIRASSNNTYVVFIGLYNPYEAGGTANEDTDFMNSWNYDTQRLLAADARAVFIPTYDIFKFNLDRYIAPDGLHPNSLGYQVVSQRIGKSIEGVFNKS